MGLGGTPRRSARVLVNQLAPGASRGDWARGLAQELPGYELSELRLWGFAEVQAAARVAAQDGVELVVAVGGDGTINACANGIGQSNTRLAVMPAGTANDLARILGQNQEPARSVAEIGAWKQRELDAISVCGTRYYSCGGVGFVADVAERANRWRSRSALRRWLMARLGSFIYTLACLVSLLSRRRSRNQFQLRYTTPEGDNQTRGFAGCGLLVANCDQLGASFRLSAESRVDDGVFELILFPDLSRWQLLRAVWLARRGRLFEIDGLECVRAVQASIECKDRTAFFGDGEVLQHGKRFEVGIEPRSFHLLAPVPSASAPAAVPVPQPQPQAA